jgi:hypothetical protein
MIKNELNKNRQITDSVVKTVRMTKQTITEYNMRRSVSTTEQLNRTAKAEIRPIQKMINKATKSLVDAERTQVHMAGLPSKAVSALKRSSFSARNPAPLNTNFNYVNKPARFTSVKHGTRISHTEYVKDIITQSVASGYSAQAFNINPSNGSLFPWLSNQAASYSSFVPHSIKFSLKSIVGAGNSGTMFLSTTPDCDDALPGSKADFLNLENVNRSNVWSDCTHVVPGDIIKRLPEYLNSTVPTAITDTTRELGQLFVGTSASGASQTVAELYVTYDISLLHSQPNTGFSAFSAFTPTVVSGIVTQAFGTAPPSNIAGNIQLQNINTLGVNDGVNLQVDKDGSYLVTCYVFYTASTGAITAELNATDNGGNALSIGTILEGANRSTPNGYFTTTGSVSVSVMSVSSTSSPWYINCLIGGVGIVSPSVFIQLSGYGTNNSFGGAESFKHSKFSMQKQIDQLYNELKLIKESEKDTDSDFECKTMPMSTSFYQRVGEAVIKATNK